MQYTEVLNQQEINDLKKQGLTETQIQQTIDEAEQEANNPLMQSYNQARQTISLDPRANASNSYIAGNYDSNLIQWQLELDSILERVEHMLRGDRPAYKQGSVIWTVPISDTEKILNDFGVAEVMRILSNYVNRNTILSNYREEVINEKMFDLGNELVELFYLKYEDMGLNTLAKRKLYPMLVRELVDVTHSAYLRALHGGERESLREARSVTQNEHTQGGVTINTGNPQQTRGLLNPMRYLLGKYKGQ